MEIRILMIAITSVLEMFFFSDVIFGFNSLTSVYKILGVFSEICNQSDKISNVTTCSEQDIYYGNAFVVWICFQSLIAIPVGLIFDKYGIKITRIIGCLASIVGSIMFGLVDFNSWFLFSAGCLSAFASQAVTLSNISIADMFGNNKNLMISTQTGLMSASSLVFAIIKILFDFGIPLYLSFSFLCCLAIVIIVPSTFILSKKTPQEIMMGLEIEVFGNSEILKKIDDFASQRQNYLLEVYPNIWTVLSSRKFQTMLISFTCTSYRFIFFLSQMGSQLTFLFSPNIDLITHLKFTSNIFFFSGILISIFVGLFLDYLQMRINSRIEKQLSLKSIAELSNISDKTFVVPFAICYFSLLLASCLIGIANKYVYYLVFMMFTIFRSFNSGLFGSYLSSVFPKKYFGTSIGVIILVAGILNTTIIYLTELAKYQSYSKIINMVMILTPISAFIHPISLYFCK